MLLTNLVHSLILTYSKELIEIKENDLNQLIRPFKSDQLTVVDYVFPVQPKFCRFDVNAENIRSTVV